MREKELGKLNTLLWEDITEKYFRGYVFMNMSVCLCKWTSGRKHVYT